MALRSFRYARPIVCPCNRLHNCVLSDAASQTSRFEAMAVDPVSELPTQIVPESANPFDSPDDPPIPSLSGERPDSESVASALAAVSRLRLNKSQRETLIASLNTSSDVISSQRSFIPVPQSGISSSTPNSASDILAAQAIMSRLNGEQRSKLAKELSNLGASSSGI